MTVFRLATVQKTEKRVFCCFQLSIALFFRNEMLMRVCKHF